MITGSARELPVLLVEDNAGDAWLATERLTEADQRFSVVSVTSLDAARAQLARREFEAVVLDLNLPDSTGLDTVREVRALAPMTPMLVLTTSLSPEMMRDVFRAGANESFEKHELARESLAQALLRTITARRTSHRRELERVLNTSLDAVLVIDHRGVVRFSNDAAVAMFGDERVAFAQSLPSFSARTGESIELRLAGAEGERIVELRLVEADWEGQPSWLATLRDVTERKSLELRLMLADRLASVGTLAAGVAHEINNPLAAIVANLGFASELLDGSTPDLRASVSDAREAAERVRQIVRDVKLFSRPQEEPHGPVDLEKVLDSTLRMARTELSHGISVVRQVAADCAQHVEGNEARLGQVFLNLVINAAYAMKHHPTSSKTLTLSVEHGAPGMLRVLVSDTGGGIDEQVRKKLFTPFVTSKPANEGTGLGLALSRSLVRDLGGELECDPAPSVGTTFIVTLRVSNKQPVVRSAPAPVAATPRLQVLCVDDDEWVLAALKRLLRSHDVTTRSDARSALTELKANPGFDAIFCDLMMPRMNGREFYEAVRALGGEFHQRIVFLSGGAITPEAETFRATAPNLFIDKPFDRATLFGALHRLGPAAAKTSSP